MTAIGELSLWIALLMGVWAIVSSFSGRMRGRADIAESGRRALIVTSGMLVLALSGLIAAFVTRDFTRVYVAAHSSSNLPLAYAIAATWSGSAGWVMMVIAAVTVFAVIGARTREAAWESARMIVAMGIVVIIALVPVCIANPFAQFDFAAADGKGLPALQQSVGFVLVPPIEALALGAATIACAVARQREAPRARKDLLWRVASLLLSLVIALRAWWTYTTLEGAHFWRWDLGSGAIVALWLMVASILHADAARRHIDSNDTSPALIGFALLFVMTAVAFGGPFNMEAETSTTDPWLRFFASAGILLGPGLAELRGHSSDSVHGEVTAEPSRGLRKLLVSAYAGLLVTLILSAIVACAVLLPAMDAWMHEAPTGASGLVRALLWIGAALVLITTAMSLRFPRTRLSPAALGRLLVHAGAIVAVLGLSSATLKTERELTVRSGESFAARDPLGRPWKFVGQGASLYDVLNRRVVAVTMEAFESGASKGLLKTEKRQIVDQRGESLGDPVTGIGFLRSALLDIRAEMTDASGEVARVRVVFIPLAFLVWLGAGLGVVGALLALLFGGGGRE